MDIDAEGRRRLVVDIAGILAAFAFFLAAGSVLWIAATGTNGIREGFLIATVLAGFALAALADSARRFVP